ncbi:MAG: stage 0 sporulation protein, partial [Planctomycetota bacterium]
WLRKLAPVSIKMARAQNRPISADSNLGSCGRLRCCLRYELGNYACCEGKEFDCSPRGPAGDAPGA